MKAIKINNQYFKVIELRGAFVYYTDSKNKTAIMLIESASIVEVDENEVYKPKYKTNKTKKLNSANFMSKEEFAKSKYSTMSKDDFLEERERDARNSKSW